MKPDPVKGVECYIDADFAGGRNQEEGKDPGSVLSRTGYVISYTNCPIVWGRRIQTEIAISITEAEYIDLSQAMRYVLHFVSPIKEIEFILKIQGDTMTVLCSLFEKPVTPLTVYEDNQGAIGLVVSPHMRSRTKHIAIKYHHFCSFVANGDVKINHFNTKEQIMDIFTKLLYSELFGYLR